MIGWILLAVSAAIMLALCIPVRICVEYIEMWRARVWLFGVIPVWSLSDAKPVKTKRTNKSKKNAKDKPSLKDEIKALFDEEGVGGVLGFFGKLARLLGTTLASLAKFITVRKLLLGIRVGGAQADEAAVLYGQLSAASAAGLATLSQLVRVRKPCVRVVPDFLSDKSQARLRTVLWVWPFGALGVGIAALWRLVVLWFKTMKTPRNGVANTTKQPESK